MPQQYDGKSTSARGDQVGSVVFVHGTGVRLKNYMSGFRKAKEVAAAAGIQASFVDCAWGDPLGVEFKGESLPEEPNQTKLRQEAEEFGRWNWRFADPLFELNQLTIRDPGSSAHGAPRPRPGSEPKWEKLWHALSIYEPSLELRLLLDRGGLTEFWEDAWNSIVISPIPREAFKASAHKLAEASHALASAVIAQLHVTSTKLGASGPSADLRRKLFERLIVDWDQEVFGLGSFFSSLFRRTVTQALRKHRSDFSSSIALPIGDVLLYQAKREKVWRFIAEKIEVSEPPVTIVAHSLGGIACVDMLASPESPVVAQLVTAGSQAPFLNEIGALVSLEPGQKLPEYFPPWLNLYDRNDFLSYVGHRIWPQVEDFEIESGQPFPDSHSAYFGNPVTWQKIRNFTGR